jgi:hypothetical protein
MFSRIGKYYYRFQNIGMTIDVNKTAHLYIMPKLSYRWQLRKGKQKFKKIEIT